MATPILALLSAGASLMPSPVMATMWPWRWSAPTMRSLCSGSTRANTRTCSTIASSSLSVMVRSSVPVTSRAPGSNISSSLAIASAVAGWSPVIMTERMCARLAVATATFASARGGSIMPTTPSSTRSSSACVFESAEGRIRSVPERNTSVRNRICCAAVKAAPTIAGHGVDRRARGAICIGLAVVPHAICRRRPYHAAAPGHPSQWSCLHKHEAPPLDERPNRAPHPASARCRSGTSPISTPELTTHG